jgi:hypothetical protein
VTSINVTEAMSTDAPNARELTRRLVASAAAQSDAPDSALLAVHAACERACGQLSRSLGQSGFHALLTRALAHAAAEHPLLKEIGVGRQPEPFLGGVTDIVETHGAPAAAAGLETLLETMFGLLGRLIGDDMVPRLVERTAPVGTLDDEDVK